MRKRIAAMAAPLVAAVAVAMSMVVPAPAANAAAFGQLPVMGYNTWYEFGGGLTETAVLQQANFLVSTGLAAAGYNTVNLDDGWLASARTSSGALTWDTTKFPDGIPFLANAIHSLGLKFGIYEAIGTQTCLGLPGSGGTTASNNHYVQDSQTFASWGVDFVKIDQCGGYPSGTTLSTLTTAFQQYGADLRAANPNVVYSEELPVYAIGAKLGTSAFISSVQSSASFANMYRVTSDEWSLFNADGKNAPEYIDSEVDTNVATSDLHLHGFAGTGHWNDLDMLVPGTQAHDNFTFTIGDVEAQLSVWAEEASPLLISTDLTTLPANQLAALKNPDIIRIDQSGSQPSTAVSSPDGNLEAIYKPADGGTAVLFVNLCNCSASASFSLSQLGISASSVTGYNIWKNETTTFSAAAITLPARASELVVMKPAS